MSHNLPDDDLERRLRDVLHSRQLSINPDADVLERIHAGAARRQRRHRAAVSGGAALAVIAVAATGIALRPTHHGSVVADRGSSSPQATLNSTASASASSPSLTLGTAQKSQTVAPSVATAPTIPAGGAPPAGFVPMSVTATTANGNTFWVLGHAPCASGTCTALAKTTDGGKTFSEVGAPPSALVPDAPGTNDVFGAGTISDVRFVDANNGWAYGGGMWQTTDGGAHWAAVPMPGSVEQLAVASGRAWAIVFTGAPSATSATYEVYSATYPGGSWAKADSAGTFGPGEPMLAVQGDAAAVLGTDAATGAQRPVAASGGSTTFTPLLTSLPCTGGAGSSLSATTGALWLACTSANGSTPGAFFSPDFGQSWQPAASKLSGTSVAVGAIDAKSAIVAAGGKLVRVGSDGSSGNVAQPSVPASTVWSFVGFTNAKDGFAIPILNNSRQLWRTTDGGSHWSVVKF